MIRLQFCKDGIDRLLSRLQALEDYGTPESSLNYTNSPGETNEVDDDGFGEQFRPHTTGETTYQIPPYSGISGIESPVILKTPEKPYIEKALDFITDMLVTKGEQYAREGEFDNFLEQARLGGMSVRQVFRGMLAQKLEREQVQFNNGFDRNDSVLDVLGYAVLWYAWEISQMPGGVPKRG